MLCRVKWNDLQFSLSLVFPFACERTMRVLTWNTWKEDKCYRQRMEAISEIIEKHSPDVIMLQARCVTNHFNKARCL